ncbi:anoctamin-1-like isoform X2 [Zerene cesonia]|uniref:anoctamin-1-like isoform X2 n=1 Tax=Zerene cesonia TaxID=33412 RepID=UPI0018E5890A|nr:anoctamin-1-like isoform X2 [Zerene cesonia]
MSDGDPSLEEDIPKPLLERPDENVFTPKIATPIFAGSVKLHHKLSDSAETESFLSDAQRNDLAFQQLFQNGDEELHEKEKETEERNADLHAMSVLSTYQDNLSQDMNTDRDGSEASTRTAEDCGCGVQPTSIDSANNNGKPANHCSIVMGGILNNPSLTFNDGVRSVDFVLVWEAHNDDATTREAFEQRRIFEQNLENEGLQLEREAPENLHGLNFIKIHAPLAVLRDYSEILKLRMPMKFSVLKDAPEKTNSFLDSIDACWDSFMSKIRVDPNLFPERKHRLTAIYSKDKEYLFDTTSDCFWTPSIRSRIVQFILDRKKFSEASSDDFAFGVARLIANNVYSAAYPLHDGDLKTPGSMRHLLYTEWASVSKCIKYQPLDYVKDYFGVKIGLYFAWLGFYTHMLIPASIVGLCCVIYSASTVYSNTPSEDVCNYNSSIKMCPQCDYFCEFWDLKATCLQSRITYLFDNSTTVFFAIFMSFWAACFLELWKRYSAEMTHRWDLTGFDVYEEHPRPQYLARLAHVKRTQLNVVTGEREPMVPFWRMRLPATLMSFSVVCLLVLLALATVLGVVLYRMSLLGAAILRQNNALITYNPIMFTTATAACINLVFICIFNYIYQFLAEWLTEKELLRTQTEFDDSLTLKIYLLQFVNYYASIFYIAFFKGKFVGRPGDYIRLFGHRQEECSPGGCFLELSIQLAIIMVGKQFINTIVEMMMPYLLKWWNVIRTIGRKNKIKSPLQWVKDFKLVDFGNMGLFPEYLEMVLQYGFVTIFVAAFPLAPLFALINNVLEMRLDAAKFLSCYRRPVPQRVNDIGVWYRILDSIGKLSIITNGFIIAFTSDFIPRLVYQFTTGSLRQYVNHTLTDFNVTVLEHPPIGSEYSEAMCSYPGYWHYKEGDDYEHSNWYWHVMGARLAFVVVFENVVALVMIVVRWAIPDMSGELRDRIRREAYVINSFIMEETRARSVASRTPRDERGRAGAGGPGPGYVAGAPGMGGAQGDVEDTHWNHIASLSGSDFDLAAHGEHQDIRDLARHVTHVTHVTHPHTDAAQRTHV